MPTQAAAQQTTDYHYILTVQRQNGIASTRSGVAHIPPGSTREHVAGQVVQEHFPNQPIAVLFFSLEPNQL
ncbi:hypothetical protein [Streptomyces sp. AS02]|uniref:hypothetical protein n=1 Tax=Streptomyces sp. AS02 TaxID=2938946 RepID=UPI0020215B5C|nr:hypothetical protein [Streptomyces sp. AS02]MCL8016866.1 hypothetical protein [Streptomyces sp. AS02]